MGQEFTPETTFSLSSVIRFQRLKVLGQGFTSETTFSLRSVICFQRLKHQGEEVDDDMEDEFYLKRLDSGLFTLQLIDYIMLEVCASGASSVSCINGRVYSH